MPVVFSPGELAVQPLDPDQIVYTTPQKVADLLNITPGDTVLAAADATASGLFITGTDLREHGFEAGDIITVYSDLDPLGTNFTITAPVVEDVGGTKYVKLPCGPVHANYTTAANTNIQNQLSFTNGKSRGVKRSHVEQRIKEVQDRIDNITHNAWRPYLVAAEYINFDTYKPYRRRYYTDYVGTAPLLFRNVQQILRLELWQGDSYREIAGAEAKVKIVDYEGLASGATIVVCPGDGGVGSLPVGPVAPATWSSSLDNITTAQSLADLVNKDSRTGKTALAFSPSFSYADATSTTGLVTAYVNNEFLATANSDYGSGVVKITSKKNTRAGETASISCDNLRDLEISQVVTKTAISGVHATGVLVNNGAGYAIGHTTAIVTNGIVATTPFAVGDSIYKSDGTLIGVLTGVAGTGGVNGTLTVSTGTLVALDDDDEIYSGRMQNTTTPTTLNVDSTEGFAKVGTLMVVDGADTIQTLGYTGKTATSFTGVAGANFLNGLGGASGSGVKGSTITQYLFALDLQGSSGDSGRLRDWWLDSEMGIIYFNNSYPFFEWNAIKATYVYGERYLEKAVEEAATKLVACDLLMADDRSILIPEGTQNVDLASKIQLWKKEAEEILNRYKEVVLFD
tara:strand:+ start:1517 stop:3397 length:1881 start_codon:yes stop_codon:yes gene_type:complete